MIPTHLSVPAGSWWVDTGLDVAQGDAIVVQAQGRWRDAWFDCDATGHDAGYLRAFAALRRCRAARWLELTACVSHDLRNARPVGEGGPLAAPASGRLYLFANDALGMYWNNSGALRVQVEVTPGRASPPDVSTSGETPSSGGRASSVARALAGAAGLAASPVLAMVLLNGAPAASQPQVDLAAQEAVPESDLADHPFAQFELNVSAVAPGGAVSEWRTLEDSGLRLLPETVTVAPGDTVDTLLISRGIRADTYSRDLVGVLNLRLDEALTLTPGAIVTMFRADGLPEGTLLALQPYRGEREAIATLLREIEAQAEALRSAYSAGEAARLAAATRSLRLADLAAVRTQPEQLFGSIVSLERHSAVLATPNLPAREVIGSTRAVTDDLSAPEGGRRSSRWMITVSGPGAVAPGYCRLVWAIGGYTGHPGSVESESLPLEDPIPVPPAILVAWVERNGREISPRLQVSRAQLLTHRPRRDSVRTSERCDR